MRRPNFGDPPRGAGRAIPASVFSVSHAIGPVRLGVLVAAVVTNPPCQNGDACTYAAIPPGAGGRNIWDPRFVRERDFTYYEIGRA